MQNKKLISLLQFANLYFFFNKKGFVAANTQTLKNWINSRFVIEMECSLLDYKNLDLFYNSKLQQLKQTNTTISQPLTPSSTTQVAIQSSVEEKVDPIAAKRHPTTRKRHRDYQHELEFSNDKFPTTIPPVSNSQHLATSSPVAKSAQMIAMSPPMVAVMPPIVAVMPPIVAVMPPIVAVPPSQAPPVVPSPPSVSQSAVGKQTTQEANKDKQAPNNGNVRPKRKFEASSCEEPKSKKPKKEISEDQQQKPQIPQKKRGKRREEKANHPNPKRPKIPIQVLPIEMSLEENLPESCDTMTIDQQLTESRDPTTLTNNLTQCHDPMDLDE